MVNEHLAANLMAEWNFNNDALDASGNGNDGTIYGAMFVPENIKTSLSFNGLNDYVDVGSGESLNLVNEITIIARVKTSSIANMSIIGRGLTGEYDHTYALDIFNGRPAFYWANEYIMGENDNVRGVENISNGQWHQLISIFDGTSIKLYIDGIFSNSVLKTTRPSSNLSLKVLIGNMPGYPKFFDGEIDNVKIYNKALTDTEIENEYIASIEADIPSDGDSQMVAYAIGSAALLALFMLSKRKK